MIEKPEVGWRQVRTLWRMMSSGERIVIKAIMKHSKNAPDNCPGGHSVTVPGFSFHPERLSPAKDSNYE
jgi:hypothetical protein